MSSPSAIESDRRRGLGVRAAADHAGQLALAAITGWLGVGITRLWDAAGDDGEGPPYTAFSIVLVLATALLVAVAWSVSRTSDRGTLRRVGLGVGVLALASTLIPWAGPLWMTLIAASVALFAVMAGSRMRIGLATISTSQVLGIAVLIAASEVELGARDSYGDYPAAFLLSVLVAAAGTVAGLVVVAREARSAGSSW